MSDGKKDQGIGALANVLAKNLNEIEDLPNFIAPPPGVYEMMIVAVSQKEINEKTVLAIDYTFVGLKQLNSQEDQAELDGLTVKWGKDRMSETFYFNDPERVEETLGALKKKFAGFAQVFGTSNLLEILQKLPNTMVHATIGQRADKQDKTKFYPYTRLIVPAQ